MRYKVHVKPSQALGFAGSVFGIIGFWFVTVIGGLIGWIANIVNVVGTIDGPLTGMLVLQCIGIVFAPLGAVMGWIYILT